MTGHHLSWDHLWLTITKAGRSYREGGGVGGERDINSSECLGYYPLQRTMWHDTFSNISVNCCYLCMHLLSPTLYVHLSCLSSYTIDVWLTLHYSIFSYM